MSSTADSGKEKLHSSNQFDEYKALFMKSDTAIAILGVDGEYLECNDAFVQLIGYDKNVLLNGFHPAMLSTEFQPDGKSSFKKAQKMLDLAVSQGKVQCEWLHKAKDGHEFLSHVTLEPISFDGVPAVSLTIRDLSEQKKLERLVSEREYNNRVKQHQSNLSLEPIITAGFILIIFMIAFYGLSIIEKDSREATGKALTTVVNTMDEGVQLWADKRIEDAQSLASDVQVIRLTEKLLGMPVTKDFLINRGGVQQLLRNNIKDILDAQGYQGFFIISPDHYNLGSMRDANIGVRNLIAEQRPDLMTRVFSGESLIIPSITSDVPLNPADQSKKALPPTMFAATPIRNRIGDVIAVFTLRLDPVKDFSKLLRLGRIGESGETYAFDHSGVMLTESRFEDQLRDIGLIESEESSILTIRITEPGKDLTKGLTASIPEDKRQLTLMVKSAVTQGNGFNVEGYSDYRGVQVYGAWIWDKRSGIGLATEIDADEALESFYLTRKVVLGSLGVTALLSLWMTFYLASRRTKALKDLEDYQAVLEDRVRERTENLLLANESMNQQISKRMRTEEQLKSAQAQLEESNVKLQNSNHDLESKVSERTNELSQALTEAKKANEAKSAFLANMSHELRTPMHSILSFTDLAMKKANDEKIERFLTNIKTSGVRLTGLLNALLDLSKLESENMEIDFKESSLTQVTSQCIEEVISLSDDKSIKIQFDESNEVTGVFDADLIHGVILNLLSNAIKFSPIGGSIYVNVSSVNKDKSSVFNGVLEFAISDEGVGVPHDELNTVFDKFVQSSNTKSKAGGTGLGLSISKEIITAHRGIIWVESPVSAKEVGASFHFIIPARPGPD